MVSPSTQRPSRYFFVALASSYALVAVIGFAPNYVDYFAGTLEIPPIAHVHGALMAAWLLLFIVQTGFAASGALKWHRTLGLAAIGLASVIWISMAVVTVNVLIRDKPEVDSFLYDVLPRQLAVIALFGLFFVWGVLVRRRASSHKRLLALATLVLLQAAVDRMGWLPEFGLPSFWPYAIRLDVLLIPLFVFDVVSIKRIHPVTLIGAFAILVAHTIISLLEGSPAWHNFAHAMVNAIR
jgi:hypothetical protein